MGIALTLARLLVKLEADNKGLVKGFDTADEAAAGLDQNVKKALGTLGVAGSIAAAGKAAVEFAKQSIESYQQFEKGLKEVYTLLPGLSEQTMGQMKEDAQAFSVEIGRTSDEVIPALYQSISAGVPQENVFDFLETASDAALGGVTSLETAVDGISSVVNAYGAEIISATEASDLMFTAVKGGKTNFEQLSRSLFNVIPTASAIGIEFGNITAALATLTAQGTPTGVATTQLRALLVELSKEGKEAAATFERIAGKSFQEFITEGGDLQEALQMMEKEASASGKTLTDMFSRVEAGNAALGLTGAGTQKYTQELKAAETSANATAVAAETMADTLEYQERVSLATKEQLMLLVGEGLTPAKQWLLEVKTAAMEGAIGLLSFRGEVEKTIGVFNETMRSSEERIERLLAVIGDAGVIGQITGASKDLGDELRNVTAEMVADSKSTEDAIARLTDVFGENLDIREDGLVSISNSRIGYIVLGQSIDAVVEKGKDLIAVNLGSTDSIIAQDEKLTLLAREYDNVYAAIDPVVDSVDLLSAKTRVLIRAEIDTAQATVNLEDALLRDALAKGKAADKTEELAGANDDLTEAIANSLSIFRQSQGLFTDLANAEEDLQAAHDQMMNAYSGDAQAAEAAQGAIEAANAAIVQSYREMAFEALLAQTGVTEATLAMGVELGLLTEAQAEQRLEYVNISEAIQELTERQDFLTASAEVQAEAVSLLADGHANTAEQAINLARVMRDTGRDIEDLDQKLTDVAGSYEIEFSANTGAIDAAIDRINARIASMGGVIDDSGVGAGPGSSGFQGPEFAAGGFTGFGSNTSVAGVVHAGEYVFSAPAVSTLGLGALDGLHNAARSGVVDGGDAGGGSGGGTIIVAQTREAMALALATVAEREREQLDNWMAVS